MQYSVVNYKEVEENNIRFEAEYFRPDFIKNEKILLSNKWDFLENLSTKITDFGAYSQNNIIEYKDTGKCIFIRNQDIKDFFIQD